MPDTEHVNHWVACAPGGSRASRWHLYRDCRALEMQRNADSLTAGEYGIIDATRESLRGLGIVAGEGGLCGACKNQRNVERMVANVPPPLRRDGDIEYRWIKFSNSGPWEIVAQQSGTDGRRWIYRHGLETPREPHAYRVGMLITHERANDNEAEAGQAFQVQGTPEGARLVAADAQSAHSTEPSFEVREALIEIREMWGAAQRLRDSTSKPEFMFRMGEIMGRLVMDGEITSTQAAAVGNWINEQESWIAAVLTILETEENNE